MLRTNSKKAAENIRVYIMGNFTPEGYTDNPPQKFPEIAAFILDTFRSEKYWCSQDVTAAKPPLLLTGAPVCRLSSIPCIFTIVRRLMTSAQSSKKQSRKKPGTPSSRPNSF